MDLSIVIKDANEISSVDRKELDVLIAGIIEKHKGNRAQINRFAFDSVTALTASENRGKELQSQGFFRRLWGGLTGSNQKLQG